MLHKIITSVLSIVDSKQLAGPAKMFRYYFQYSRLFSHCLCQCLWVSVSV